MATNEARNLIVKDTQITNVNLLELVDGSATTLHSHSGPIITTGTATIGGAANTGQLIIKANANQTNLNPLVELQDSSGLRIGQWHADHVYNDFLGVDSGKNNVVSNPQGRHLVFIGYQSGMGNVNGYYNTCVGFNTGVALADGHHNTFIGYLAGEDCYSNYCTFIGSNAGKNVTTGNGNTAIGETALGVCTTGGYNFAIGASALGAVISGERNLGLGPDTGLNLTGSYNTLVGYRAGYTLANVNGNVMLGYYAGYYETGANKLFIDNAERTNEVDSRVKALLYGMFDAAVANQFLTINGRVGVNTAPTAHLHLPAGAATAGYAPLKFTTGTLLATPEAGTIEYGGNRLYITNVATQRPVDRTSDVAVETVTVANTTTETTVWTGTMAANSLIAGNVFRILADGVVSNASAGAGDQVILRVKINDVEQVKLEPVLKNFTNEHWHITGNATQRTLGVAGERAMHIDLVIGNDTVALIATGTVNTEACMDITITVEWASAKATNTFSLYQGFMGYRN